jgi:FADH2 O2-dependent halogenase
MRRSRFGGGSAVPQDASDNSTDVVILGGGIAGSMLAAILARQGLSVQVLEAGVHPQFAIGEAMIPETGAWFRLMSLRFDIPELDFLSNFQGVRHHVSSACGIKRAFSYVYHREGELPRTEENLQFPTIAPPLGWDTHFFRQDLDQWMLAVAMRYGAKVRQGCRISSVEPEKDGWLLQGEAAVFRCRFLIDGAGYRSPLVKLFGLREEPCRQRTNSRSMFTHMVGVRPWDTVLPPDRTMLYPFAQSTLHHVFHGGWLWVIPFNNHRDATNPLCSVGLQFDRTVGPDDTRPAQQQFDDFLGRFPGVARQFADARAIRPWITTGRLQYSSKSVAGERYFLLPHAAGFIDPLFSSGLGFMAWTVNGLAAALIAAKRTNDWSVARFRPIEEWTQKHFNHFDRVVSGAYTSFADFDLWNAWFRIWVIGNFHGALSVISRYMKYLETHDRSHIDLPAAPHRGFGSADFDDYTALLGKAEAHVLAFKAGQVSGAEASRAIFALVGAADFCPSQIGLAVSAQRCFCAFNLPGLARWSHWSRTAAPKRIHTWFYNFSRLGMRKLSFAAVRQELSRGMGGVLALIRDFFVPWGKGWQRQAGPLPHDMEAPSARPPGTVAIPANEERVS